MAAFRFPLQIVLERRAALETEKKTQLLNAERAASLEREAVVALETHFGALGRAFARTEQSDSFALRETLVELDLVRAALGARRSAAGAADDRARAAREEYVAARREREQLQTLRDRAYAAHLAARESREAAEHDEANAAGRTLSP